MVTLMSFLMNLAISFFALFISLLSPKLALAMSEGELVDLHTKVYLITKHAMSIELPVKGKYSCHYPYAHQGKNYQGHGKSKEEARNNTILSCLKDSCLNINEMSLYGQSIINRLGRDEQKALLEAHGYDQDSDLSGEVPLIKDCMSGTVIQRYLLLSMCQMPAITC